MNDTTKPVSPKAYLGAMLEALLNQTLALDPDLPKELSALDGRSMTLTWSGPEWAMRIRVEKDQLRVGPAENASSDLSLRSTVDGLLGLLRPESAKAVPAGRVQVSGDVELMRQIEKLSKRFDPDWESAFARRLGPIFGPQVVRHLRDALSWISASAKGLGESAAEYVQEERRDTVAAAEIDDFSNDVERLRDDVDRMEARLRRFASRAGAR